MKAHIDWKVGIIRTGEKFEQYGDPYEFVCFIAKEGKRAHITGANGRYSRGMREAIKAEVIAQGIEEVTWERMNNRPREKNVRT